MAVTNLNHLTGHDRKLLEGFSSAQVRPVPLVDETQDHHRDPAGHVLPRRRRDPAGRGRARRQPSVRRGYKRLTNEPASRLAARTENRLWPAGESGGTWQTRRT